MIGKKPLKILFFINGLRNGGKERQCFELVKKLTADKATYEIHLCLMDEEVHFKEIFKLQIPVHFLLRKFKKDPTVFIKLFRLVKKAEIQIIHTWDTMTSFYSLPVKIFTNTLLVDGSIRWAPSNKIIPLKEKLLHKLTFMFADAIVGNSKAGIKALNSPGKKSFVCYNGFDFQRLTNLREGILVKKELSLNTQDLIVGMVANFSHFKDYESYIISANRILENRQNVVFIAIGEGDNLQKIKDMVSDLNSNKIKFPGKKQNVEDYINIFDIAVLSSRTEGLSNSIIEYMALGKPVIATNVGGTSELVMNEKTGLLVNPGDPDDLTKKIEFLLDNEKIRNEMGIASKQRIQGNFNINQSLSAYEKIYNSITDRKDHPNNHKN